MPTPPMHKYAYPIETPEAYKFWASRHVCNQVKAIISFSRNLNEANDNLRKSGFQRHFRKRAINAWQHYVGMPEMDRIPFTPMGIEWWDCMPHTPEPPPTGRWVRWIDDEKWTDPQQWVEWKEDTPPLPLGENKNDDTSGNDSEKAAD